ncbi:MAG: hypothetical protein ABIS86_05090, partial [Streptosporangiaceae bacterium]
MRIDLKRVLSGEDHPADPWPGYARLREEPVRRVRLREGLFCWVVSGYAEARAALSDPRLSRDPRFARAEWREADRGRALEDGANLGVHLLTREPPDHTRMRRLVTADFSTHQAAAVRGRLRELADSLIDGFAPRGTAELIADFAYPLAISMIADVLGVPKEDHSIFRQWTSNAVRHA